MRNPVLKRLSLFLLMVANVICKVVCSCMLRLAIAKSVDPDWSPHFVSVVKSVSKVTNQSRR